MKFRTTILAAGKTATGLPVPDQVVAALGGGKRAAVVVTVGAYTYRSTVAPMGGVYMIPLSGEHRTRAGLAAGQEVDVELTLDTAPRQVVVPDDLAAALRGETQARAFFDGLSVSHRKAYVTWIEEAKKPETRAGRVVKAVEMLRAGTTR